jgi:plastocyanin
MQTTRPSTRRARRLAAGLAAVLLLGTLGACGGDDDDSSSSADNAPATDADATLDVTSFLYKDVTAPAGGTLAVVNSSGGDHTFTADDESAGFDVPVPDGKTVTVDVPAEAGKYGFHCEIHPNMKATLTAQ